jgi:hypothetical protein
MKTKEQVLAVGQELINIRNNFVKNDDDKTSWPSVLVIFLADALIKADVNYVGALKIMSETYNNRLKRHRQAEKELS